MASRQVRQTSCKNLRIGRTVIADSVNPLAVTRAAWSREHIVIDTAGGSLKECVQTLRSAIERHTPVGPTAHRVCTPDTPA